MNMNIYKYEDIESDKKSYLYLISEMRNVYKYKELHTQLLECDQWTTMLNRKPIKTEYTADALLALKNIVNDAVNYLTGVKGRFNDGELAIELINKICKLFSENKIND